MQRSNMLLKFVGKFNLFHFGGLLLQNWEEMKVTDVTQGIYGTDWPITLIMFSG